MNESPPIARKVVALHHKNAEQPKQQSATHLSQLMTSHLLHLDTLARNLIFSLVLLPSVISLGLIFGASSLPPFPTQVLTISFGSLLLALGFALASLMLIQHPTNSSSQPTLVHYFDQLSLKKRWLLTASSLLSFFAGALLAFTLLLSSI